MDVDATSFQKRLPEILKHIANAHFVAFDLELSGIPPRKFGAKQPTLQDRYTENKAAAEKFHILQLGLTCVEEDSANGVYFLRPYNLNISPLIGDDLGIERSFTYSASAVIFLLKNGYDMASPFEKGITYLTRAETATARQNLMRRYDRDSIPDVFIRPSDSETPKFMARVRGEIKQWKETRKPDDKGLEIRNPNPNNARNPYPLDRLQRRIVHQIVRSDFADLQTASRGDGVLVQVKDPKEEEESRNFTKRRIARDLNKQIGVRWIAEAIAGNYETAMEGFESGSEVQTSNTTHDFQESGVTASATKPKVILGHNCFMDLVFLYKLFYGDLPDRLEDFQAALHDTFPLAFDSKYVATESDRTGEFKRLALSDLENVISTEGEQPSLQIPAEHLNGVGFGGDKYHEAGFDSFVTAKVFLRLACRAGTAIAQEVDVHKEGWSEASTKSQKRKGEKSATAAADGAKTTRSSHSNIYESLSDAEMAAAADELERSTTDAEKPVSTSNALAASDQEQELAALERDVAALGIGDGSGKLLPRWDDAYWNVYRNRLRVYGTVEEECCVDSAGRATSSTAMPEKEVASEAPVSDNKSDGSSKQESVRKPSRRTSVFERFKKALNPFE